jgi:hypothetical protein
MVLRSVWQRLLEAYRSRFPYVSSGIIQMNPEMYGSGPEMGPVLQSRKLSGDTHLFTPLTLFLTPSSHLFPTSLLTDDATPQLHQLRPSSTHRSSILVYNSSLPSYSSLSNSSSAPPTSSGVRRTSPCSFISYLYS